jgi:hypothetical protein
MHAATGRAQRSDVGGLSGRGGADEEIGALQLPSAGVVISNRHFTSHPLVINDNLLMAIRAVSYAAAANAKVTIAWRFRLRHGARGLQAAAPG